MGCLTRFHGESGAFQTPQTFLSPSSLALSGAIIFAFELVVCGVYFWAVRMLSKREITVEQYTERFRKLVREMGDFISQGEKEPISSLYWEGFGAKEHLIWALRHIERPEDGSKPAEGKQMHWSEVIPTEAKYGQWSGIRIVKGVDPRKTIQQQYSDRFTLMVLEMRNVILQGQDKAHAERYWEGYGPKESVMFILHHNEKMNDKGFMPPLSTLGKREGIKIVNGVNTRLRPLDQYIHRLRLLGLEMRSCIKHGNEEAITPYFQRGWTPKERIIWTLHHIDLIDDDGIIPLKGETGRIQGIRIVECLDGIPVGP